MRQHSAAIIVALLVAAVIAWLIFVGPNRREAQSNLTGNETPAEEVDLRLPSVDAHAHPSNSPSLVIADGRASAETSTLVVDRDLTSETRTREIAAEARPSTRPNDPLRAIPFTGSSVPPQKAQAPTSLRKAHISGVVLGKNGICIANAMVTAVSAEHPDSNNAAQTGRDGSFRLFGVHGDRIRVECRVGRWHRVLAKNLEVPSEGITLRCDFPDDPQSYRFHGQVTDSRGRPVPTYRLAVYSSTGRTAVNLLRNAVDGSFDFEVKTRLPTTVDIDYPRDELNCQLNLLPGRIRVTNTDKPIAIQLEDGSIFEGRVVDEHGQGVSGASVSATIDRPYSKYTQSDEDGRWKHVGLPDMFAVDVSPPQNGGYAPPPEVVIRPGTPSLITTLQKAVSVQGRVVGPEGVAMGQGAITAIWSYPGVGDGASASCAMKQDSTFEVRGMPKGAIVSLHASVMEAGDGPNRIKTAAVYDIRAGARDVTIQVELGVEVSGVVVDKNGDPVARGKIQFNHVQGGSTFTLLGKHGAFIVGDAKRGRHKVHVFSPGVAPLDAYIDAPAKRLRIEVSRAGDDE